MTQAVSFPFEALFLLGTLASFIALVATIILVLRRRRAAAERLAVIVGVSWAAYLSIVFLVAAATPQQIIPMNHDLCFDEMCFAVIGVRTTEQLGATRASGTFTIVTIRLSSRARGRAQSERGLRALLWSDGHRYEVSTAGQSAWEQAYPQSHPLNTRLGPGQSILSDQVFDVFPQTRTTDRGLILTNGFTPGYLVIGECPLFHKPTILRLSP